MRSTTVDNVVDLLRGRIHRGELSPGDRLSAERELAGNLGVGRVTLRSALSQLQSEGYLEVKRGTTGGNFVTGLQKPYARWVERMRENRTHLDDLIEFRLAVERRAAELAAKRADAIDIANMADAVTQLGTAENAEAFRHADSVFHSSLARASKSPRLVSAIEDVRGEMFAPTDQLRYKVLIDRSRTQHEDILDAIEARDAAAAAVAVSVHLETTRQELVELLTEPQGRVDNP